MIWEDLIVEVIYNNNKVELLRSFIVRKSDQLLKIYYTDSL